MKALFYDTESSGLPLYREPSGDPRQPHIIQLAAILEDIEIRRPLCSVEFLIRPDHWTVDDGAAAVHGYTTQMLLDRAVFMEPAALQVFLDIYNMADFRCGHNEAFDARMIRIALKRFSGDESADTWKAAPSLCTMGPATKACKIQATAKMRAAGRHHHKSAKLTEAYQHFFGKELEGAHSALVDAMATRDIFYKMLDGDAIKLPDIAPAAAAAPAEEPARAATTNDKPDEIGFL